MHDPFGVGRGQPVAHVRGDAHGVIHRQAAALVQQPAQAAARQVFHHHVDVVSAGLQRIDGDDVGVIQAARRAGFLEKTLEGDRVSLRGGGQFLDGDRAVEEGVLRQVDRPEGALAESRVMRYSKRVSPGVSGMLVASVIGSMCLIGARQDLSSLFWQWRGLVGVYRDSTKWAT